MKGGFKILFTVAKMSSAYFMYFMLAILLLFPLFEIIKKVSAAGDIMGTVMTAIKEIMSGLSVWLEGAMMIFQAFFGSGTFGERLMLLVKGFGKIFLGLHKILWAVLKGILKLAVGIVVGIIALWFNIVLKVILGIVAFFKNPTEILGKLRKKIWDDGILKWFNNKFPNGIISSLKDGFWSMTERIAGWLGDIFQRAFDAIKPFALGGTVMGGMSLVGERGPELVKMPRGSRVFSNSTSRSMLANSGNNTINVSVNGRVGASDSELRDIAKKVGRMVSSEINRTTSSSTNVRY